MHCAFLPGAARAVGARIKAASLRSFQYAGGAAAVALALAGAAPASAAPLTDAQILGIYIQVNGFDIETALLGQSHAGSDGVRQLAAHVASDHLGVRQAAFALAEKCKVTPSLPDARNADAADHGRTMARLAALKSADFDRAYVEHEVAFHTAAIGAVRTALLPSATCPELRAHFQDILPAFEHHLAMTQALATK